MMIFEEALSAMRKGTRVHRRWTDHPAVEGGWHRGVSYEIRDGAVMTHYHDGDRSGGVVLVSSCDLLANDWEISE